MKLQKLGVDKNEGDELVTKDSMMHTSTVVEKENSLRKVNNNNKRSKG
jgi:hypothetical protein